MFDDYEYELKRFKDEICGAFSLSPGDIEDFHMESADKKGVFTVVIEITLADKTESCPHCGCQEHKFHAYSWSTVNFNIINGRNCHIRLRRRRYKCKECGKTWSQFNPFVTKKTRISKECIYNILEDLRKPEETFTSTAMRYNLSPTAVVNIFDSCVRLSRLELPKYMSIDENYCFKEGKSKFACLLIDFKTQEAIDVLPNRYKSDLIHYFLSIPLEERQKVKAVGIDMYPNYRDAIRATFPETTLVVIDRFHLVKEFTTQADKIRLRFQKALHKEVNSLKYQIKKMKEKNDFMSQSEQEEFRKLKALMEEKDKAYYLLKNFNFLIYLNPAASLLDPNFKKKYNAKFKQYLNYYDIQEKLFQLVPSLQKCFEIKKDLTDLYTYKSPSAGTHHFDQMIDELSNSPLAEMKHFGTTMKKWRTEILNSLMIVDQIVEVQRDGSIEIRDRRLHNGVIERKNKVLKILKNVANGYTNFERFRQRALYVMRDRAPVSFDLLYPSLARRKTK